MTIATGVFLGIASTLPAAHRRFNLRVVAVVLGGAVVLPALTEHRALTACKRDLASD